MFGPILNRGAARSLSNCDFLAEIIFLGRVHNPSRDGRASRRGDGESGREGSGRDGRGGHARRSGAAGPRLARRHELDLPYYLVILPLLKLGLIWNAQDLKDIDPDTAKKMKRQRLIPANAGLGDWLLLLQSNVVELLVLTASACVLYQFVRTALGI